MKMSNTVLFYATTMLLTTMAITCCAADASDGHIAGSVRNVEINDDGFAMYSDKNCSYARVRRGRDWDRGDQDGGNGSLGTVMEMLYVDGNVMEGVCWVKWDSDQEWLYAYPVGFGGIFSLYVVYETRACPVYDNKTCPYTRVKRGPDWIARGLQNQDGGVGNLGTVVGTIVQDNVFCKVIWDRYKGIQYPYPIGVEGQSYLCTVEASDHDVNEFVDGFDMDAFIESIFYWTTRDGGVGRHYATEDVNTTNPNPTDQVNTATLLPLETLCMLFVVWTTICNL